ncbi:MAG: hypothetical protein JW774_08810 [Candidatus Aureabacteria bacterium]|nr:hypothetical protein [Candidatus Auribacterota bacterium]
MKRLITVTAYFFLLNWFLFSTSLFLAAQTQSEEKILCFNRLSPVFSPVFCLAAQSTAREIPIESMKLKINERFLPALQHYHHCGILSVRGVHLFEMIRQITDSERQKIEYTSNKLGDFESAITQLNAMADYFLGIPAMSREEIFEGFERVGCYFKQIDRPLLKKESQTRFSD